MNSSVRQLFLNMEICNFYCQHSNHTFHPREGSVSWREQRNGVELAVKGPARQISVHNSEVKAGYFSDSKQQKCCSCALLPQCRGKKPKLWSQPPLNSNPVLIIYWLYGLGLSHLISQGLSYFIGEMGFFFVKMNVNNNLALYYIIIISVKLCLVHSCT